jgi:hypothetical protein
MNHLEFLQHYEKGFEDGNRQAAADKVSTTLMTTLFSYFFKMLFVIVLFCPGIISAYLIMNGVQHYSGSLTGWNYAWVLMAIVYILECFIFFIKGLGIKLKKEGSVLLIIPWLIGGLYCFGFPVFILHTFIFDLLRQVPGHPTNILSIFSWIVSGLMGVYIYSKYHWQLDTAPRCMGWVYRIGKRV